MERPKAKERMHQKPGGKQGEKVSSVKFTEQTGDTRDKVGKAIGMSGPTNWRTTGTVSSGSGARRDAGLVKQPHTTI